MGRGRAKAKHTKNARKLKYASPSLDLDRLQSDLSSALVWEHDDHDELLPPDPQTPDTAEEHGKPTT
ncbi:Protein of unknown function (DUF3073) [Parafrankia irregularis]|uniref:DUF3073 domain-containing protein n=2 Tax=Parafrankia TaxID=2994362 RepID=A0A0S4QNH9_9ACTN|nr:MULTISPECIES: DUF3073 family protein [Parafrankia]MBE3200201.1 DUF3073 family protein [Parafrankia sp. CH37]CUU56606.1 Protein of unknown function (DUF3073) [Parafrankia irregularis]